MKLRLMTLSLMVAGTLGVSAVTPLWMRDIRISPDGTAIAFTYKGDIFTVPSRGGEARRLTTGASYESAPVWSPDGKKIAFASDREGGHDIYVMNAAGGEALRLTSNSANEMPETFTPDGKFVVYSAAIQAPSASLTFPGRSYTQLYKVPVDGGTPEQILGTPAKMVSYLPDGSSFLYHDVKGVEDEWRKHHTSSVTRDIWRYDASTGKHVNLTARGGEDRNPVVSSDGSTVYFLSERDGGSFNVHAFPLSDPSQVRALTHFTTHPVRFLSRGGNGVLAFGYDGEIYTMDEKGGTPVKVSVEMTLDEPHTPVHNRFTKGAEDAVVSPDGKQVAFVRHGDVFVTSTDYSTTRQITSTPQAESTPSWGDSRTLYYTSDRDGHNNIYRARISRKEDPNFPNATLIEETAVFAPADGVDRCRPVLSPNGQRMAFVQDRNKIAVMDLDTRSVRMLTDGETYTARDAEIEFNWSPDSEWLVSTIDVHQRDPYYDIALINANTGEMINITDDAYTNYNPRWVMGGDAVIFESDRYGMKNHASWGSSYDVLIAFTNQEAYDRYRLSPEDYELLKEVEKEQKKASSKAEGNKKNGKKSKKDNGKDKAMATEDNTAEKMTKVEADGIRDRVVRLTPFSSSLADYYVDDDGKTLYFLSSHDDGYDLWEMDMREGDVSLSKKLGTAPMSMQPDAAGKNLFMLGRGTMKKMDLSGGKMSDITFSATQTVDPVKEREYLYEYIVSEVPRRFLVKDMFGADWKGLTDAYRRFLPHINNNYDFAEMAGELLGELNVSHTGCRYYPDGSKEPTASLGLLYDHSYTGEGVKVSEVIEKGPFDRASSALRPGSVITAVNGVAADMSFATLNGQARRKTLISFTDPSGIKHEEVVLPITQGSESDLLYNRWVERNRHIVDSLSDGRLGYVHLRSMSDDSYRTIYSDVLGRYAHCDGIVIDTRFNGGGRLHEDIEVLFSGKKYLTQEIQGVKSGEMPSRRWLRPSVMVTGEANYSNAHGTPWMYKHMGLGKLVGMPVPGTMSSVNWITMQDPSLVFGIPVVAFRTADGNYLENTQLEPDVRVANAPDRIVAGIDDQLAAAVRTLLEEISAEN